MWNWLVYAALIVGALAILSALALLGLRVLQALRSFKRLRRHVARELGHVAEKADAAVAKLDSVSDTQRLDRSIARLRESLARLAVLRAAWDEATRFTALIPHK